MIDLPGFIVSADPDHPEYIEIQDSVLCDFRIRISLKAAEKLGEWAKQERENNRKALPKVSKRVARREALLMQAKAAREKGHTFLAAELELQAEGK